MTVLDASNKLFEWFAENDSFCIELDYSKIFPSSQGEEERGVACVINSLESFEKLDVVSSALVGTRQVWTLNRGLGAFNQNIELTPEDCLSIGHVINGFCEYIGDEASKCDVSQLSRENVLTLATICASLIKDKVEELDSGDQNNELFGGTP